MSKELVIGSNRHETKVAILEDDQLVEVYFQRANEYSLAGSIHKGRVTRVLPGMQSAFVDLGLERDTFLYVSDFFEENEDIDTVEEKPARTERRERGPGREGQGRGELQIREGQGRETQGREPREVERPERAGEEQPEVRQGATERSPEAPFAGEGEPGPAVVLRAEPTEGAEQKSGERNEQDRNFRGDRNGRRPRRRRQRGRGFPENKYAQTSPAPVTLKPESHSDVANDEKEDTGSADVIILPGESLAKYRHSGTLPERSESDRVAARVPSTTTETEQRAEANTEPAPEPIGEDADAASEEDLEAEAEEIELADKVFGHNGSVMGEEEKIAEVKEDLPEPEPEAEASAARDEQGSASQEASSGSRSEPADADDTAETTRLTSFRAYESSEPLRPTFVPSEPEPPEGEPLALDEFEAADIEDAVIAEYDVLDEGPEAVGEAEPNANAGGEPTQQSAMVRDPGSRFPHRSSRRMRRRRGGNRFGNAGRGPQESGAPELVGAAAGAAPAMQPEFRAEPKREATEGRAERPERALPSISDLLKAGQEIIVQIAKEPLGQKGARITSHIALPGRYVVFMPSVSHLGVSRKVSSEEERQRLKRILQTHRAGTTGGFIIRTAGEGVSEEEIAADMNFLYTLWLDIRQKAEKKPAPALLHHDLDIVERILRDQVTDEFKAIWVDNEDMYENTVTFMQRFQPSLVNRVKMYTRSAPIFDAFNITQELEKALRPKVWLKSGGYIVINQTEALVAIDINTGKYVGKSNRLEDTIVKTNTEAVKEIVRQIRLRDLGGIIVVDFIDMDERKNRQKVMQALEEAMRADRAPYKILQFNDFGLVAITRKRVKQSLERTLCAPCPYCEGAGYVKSVQTVIGEILVEAQKLSKAIEGNDVVLRVHPDVAKVLKASDNRFLDEIEEILKRPVLVKGDPTLHHEKFDLA